MVFRTPTACTYIYKQEKELLSTGKGRLSQNLLFPLLRLWMIVLLRLITPLVRARHLFHQVQVLVNIVSLMLFLYDDTLQ